MRVLLLAATVLVAGIALAPTAESTSCTTGDPTLDVVVCTPILIVLCMGGGAMDPKDAIKRCVDPY